MSDSSVAVKKPSALDNLRALSAKKPTSTTSPLSIQTNDPAIAGATRDKGSKSSTVKLGFDPSVAEKAAYAAGLKAALEKAEADFEISQAEMRDYGKDKRDVYNDTFKSNVTTVCVPYTIEVPNDQNSDTPGRETRYVQVICTNRYSVQVETVLNNRETLGDLYEKLFVEEHTKILKPNAESLIRDLLGEMGLKGDELENSMQTLFDEKVKVSTQEHYETEVKKASDEIRALLAQAVTKVSPGLKFSR
jgi:hypothetical protein